MHYCKCFQIVTFWFYKIKDFQDEDLLVALANLRQFNFLTFDEEQCTATFLSFSMENVSHTDKSVTNVGLCLTKTEINKFLRKLRMSLFN